MSGETKQGDQTAQVDFTGAIASYVESHPAEPKAVDHYHRQFGEVAISPEFGGFDRISDSDGRLEFGEKYEVRRLEIGNYELIFAQHTEQDDRSEFLIHEFSEKGGLASRTTFTKGKEGVMKTRKTNFATSYTDSYDFSRQLTPEEKGVLELFISKPEAHLLAIEYLTSINDADVRQAIQKRLGQEAANEEFREALRAIEEAERQADQYRNLIIG